MTDTDPTDDRMDKAEGVLETGEKDEERKQSEFDGIRQPGDAGATDPIGSPTPKKGVLGRVKDVLTKPKGIEAPEKTETSEVKTPETPKTTETKAPEAPAEPKKPGVGAAVKEGVKKQLNRKYAEAQDAEFKRQYTPAKRTEEVGKRVKEAILARSNASEQVIDAWWARDGESLVNDPEKAKTLKEKYGVDVDAVDKEVRAQFDREHPVDEQAKAGRAAWVEDKKNAIEEAPEKMVDAVSDAGANVVQGTIDTAKNLAEEGRAAKRSKEDVENWKGTLEEAEGKDLDADTAERLNGLNSLSDDEFDALSNKADEEFRQETGRDFDENNSADVKEKISRMYDNLSDDQKDRVYEGHAKGKDLTAMTTVRSRHANEALKALTEVAASNIGDATSKGWDLAQGLVKMTFTNPHALSSSGRAIGLAMGSMELAGDLAEKAAKQYGVNVDGNEPLKEDTLKYRLYMRAKKHGSEAVGNTFHAISRSLDGLGVDDIRQLTPDQLHRHLQDMQAEKNRLLQKIQDDDAARAKARGRWGGINNEALDVNLHPDEHGALSRDDRGLVMAQINHLSKYMDGVSKQAKNLDRMASDSKKLVKQADDRRRLQAQQFLGDGSANPWSELLRTVDPNHRQELDPETGLPISSSYVRKMISTASSLRQNKLKAGTLTDEEDAKYTGWIKELTSYMDDIQQGQRQIPVREFGEMWAHIARMHPNMKKYADNVSRRGIWPSDKPSNIIKESIQNWVNEKGPDTPEGQVGLMWLESFNRFTGFKAMNDFISRVNTEDLDALKVYHADAVNRIKNDLTRVNGEINELSKTAPNSPEMKRLEAERDWLYSQWQSEKWVMSKMSGLTHQDIIRDNQMFNKEFQNYHAALVAQYRRDKTFNPDDPAVARARNRLSMIERVLTQKYNPPNAGLRGYSSKVAGVGGGARPKGMGPLGGGATGGKGAGPGGMPGGGRTRVGATSYGVAGNKLGVSVLDMFTEDELKDPANVETARTTLNDALSKIGSGDPASMKEGYDALLQVKNIANDPQRVNTILQDGAQKGISSYAVRLANDVLEKMKNGESVGSADISGAQTYALYASLLEKDDDGSIAQMLRDLNVSQDMIDRVEKAKAKAGKVLQNSMAMGGDVARKAGSVYRKALLNAATKAVTDLGEDDADAENVFKLWESVKEYPALGEAYETLKSGKNADRQMAQRFAAAFSEDGGFSDFYASIDPETPEGQALYERYGWNAQREPGAEKNDKADDSTLKNMTAKNWANLIRDFDDFKTKQVEESKNPQNPYTRVPQDDHSSDDRMYSTVGDQFTRETLGTNEGAAAAHNIYSRNFVDDNDVRTNVKNARVVARLVKDGVGAQIAKRGRPADPRVTKREERMAERDSLENLLQSMGGGRGSDEAKVINRLLDANYAEEAADLITDMITSIDTVTKEVEEYEPVMDANGKPVMDKRTKKPKTKLVKKMVKLTDAEKKQAMNTLGQLRHYLQFDVAGECRKNAFIGTDADSWRKWKLAPWSKTDTDGNISEVNWTGFRQDLIKMVKKELTGRAGSKPTKDAYEALVNKALGGLKNKPSVTTSEPDKTVQPVDQASPQEAVPKTKTKKSTKWDPTYTAATHGDAEKILKEMTPQNKADVVGAISFSAGDVKNPANLYASTLLRKYGIIDKKKTGIDRLNDMLSSLGEVSAELGDDPEVWPEEKKIIERKKELLQTRLLLKELTTTSNLKAIQGNKVAEGYVKQLIARVDELQSNLFIHADNQTLSDISERKLPLDIEGLKAELKKKGVDLDATESEQNEGAGKTYTDAQKAAQKAFNDAQDFGGGDALRADMTKKAVDYIRPIAEKCGIELTPEGKFKSEEDKVKVSNKILEDTGWLGNDRMCKKVKNLTGSLWTRPKTGGRKSYKETREAKEKAQEPPANLRPENIDQLVEKAVGNLEDFNYILENKDSVYGGMNTPEEELGKKWGDALARYAGYDDLDTLLDEWKGEGHTIPETVKEFDPNGYDPDNDELLNSLYDLYVLVDNGIAKRIGGETGANELNTIFDNIVRSRFGEPALNYWYKATEYDDGTDEEDE